MAPRHLHRRHQPSIRCSSQRLSPRLLLLALHHTLSPSRQQRCPLAAVAFPSATAFAFGLQHRMFVSNPPGAPLDGPADLSRAKRGLERWMDPKQTWKGRLAPIRRNKGVGWSQLQTRGLRQCSCPAQKNLTQCFWTTTSTATRRRPAEALGGKRFPGTHLTRKDESNPGRDWHPYPRRRQCQAYRPVGRRMTRIVAGRACTGGRTGMMADPPLCRRVLRPCCCFLYPPVVYRRSSDGGKDRRTPASHGRRGCEERRRIGCRVDGDYWCHCFPCPCPHFPCHKVRLEDP
mmetsp:Transcript_4190/g.11561  ORF Transcript_4190/g.11561 Transcript_4190/m.11561 type:complete len:289 (+) Transcript_4190:1987-2853(+)